MPPSASSGQSAAHGAIVLSTRTAGCLSVVAMFDVIIVGARCAGAATALLLARQGHRVLLVDKARFPSDVPQGHFIHWSGPQRLQRWGLLDRITASNCPRITTSASDHGDFRLSVSGLEVDGVAWGYGPRRKVLDQILIDAAIAAGVEFREGLSVDGYLAEAGQIHGIRGHCQGAAVEARAPLTIGADGRHSGLARFVSAPEYHVAPTLACYYFSYWADVPHDGFENYRIGNRVIFAHPTNDNLFTIFVGWPVAEHQELRADLEGAFQRTLDLVPEFAARVRSGRRAERLYGASHLPNFFRKPHGPGWALVGDAGCHKDPYLALGMSDALRDAELLSDAVHRSQSGTQPLEQALAGYEQRRNEHALPLYETNLSLADLSRPLAEQGQVLRAAVRDDPSEARRYLMAAYGMIPRDDFFNPANMDRLMSRLRARGHHANT